LFSTKEFIEASRAFVCIRIEPYENKEAEERIRALLNGRYANTSFCMFDPQGKRHLTRTGRSPEQAMGRKGSGDNEDIINQMNQIASRYRPKGKDNDAVLQDFLSFGQALNVASADQRLLVFVNADRAAIKKLSPTLKKLFTDQEVIGRFHLDFIGEQDEKWNDSISGAKSTAAINIIQAGKFGLDGSIVSRLPLESTLEEIKTALLADNEKFNSTEQRKDYASHVMEGKRKGIKFESEIPYGEDMDGDGEIDPRRGGGGGGKGRAGGGGFRPGGGGGRNGGMRRGRGR